MQRHVPVTLNSLRIPQAEDAKYLGSHLDSRLNWRKRIFTKRKQLGIQLGKMCRLLGSKLQLSTENKLLLYAVLKPIWVYDIQLWSTASNSNIEILQRFQNRYLGIIVNPPWYVTNDTTISTYYTLERRLKSSARDTPIGWKNILATNLMKKVETID